MTIQTTPTRIHPVSWDEFHRDARKLAGLLKDLRDKNPSLGPWKAIISITRGGLQPAAIVARELNIRIVETVSAIFYNDQTRNDNVELVKPISDVLVRTIGGALGQDLLVIDDLVDSGETAKKVKERLPRFVHYATLYCKPKGALQVHTCVQQFPQDTWIRFPWDKDPPLVSGEGQVVSVVPFDLQPLLI
jgi:xanthine phosphoribosyltransferase